VCRPTLIEIQPHWVVHYSDPEDFSPTLKTKIGGTPVLLELTLSLDLAGNRVGEIKEYPVD